MTAFLHQVFSGLASGGIYASVALALVLIYQATHLVNFAQGEMAMFATYVAWALVQAGLPYWPAFLLTLAISFAGGVAIERIVIRPFDKAPVLASVCVFIGLLSIFNSLAGFIFTYTIKTFPSPFGEQAWYGTRFLSPHETGEIVVTLALLVLVYAFFRFTPLGLAMRAAAQNPASSRLVGIRVGWMLALGWGLAAAAGAVAGMMAAPIVYLEPNMMGGILLYGFAGALLGGIDNPWGAVLGGFMVGVLENLAGGYVVGADLKLTAALVIIVGVLVIRPSGLFGRPIAQRV
ncbi:MAG TPA: branched-chain amino acid ABC transporter permease [Stellaceae bacterium]|nr:branched-chain amino acid ABC transporter permease [Stellaceae bacterium]